MLPIIGMILIFGVVFLAIVVAPKLKINFGFFTLSAAFLIGYWVLGLDSGAILAYFPARIAIIFILFTYFSGIVRRAGVFQGIADRVLYVFRRHTAFIPWSIFFATAAVCAVGGGPLGAQVICGPIALSIAEAVGFAPIIAVMMVCVAANIQFWWVHFGSAVHVQLVADNVGPGYDQTILVYILIASLVISLIGLILTYVIFRGWKNTAREADIQKPTPFTSFQKKVLFIVIAFVVLIAVPSGIEVFTTTALTTWMVSRLDMYVLAAIACCALTIMKVEDGETVVKEDIPWSLILMLCGTSMLVGLLNDFGTVDYLSQIIANSVHPVLIIPSLLLIGGILTMFANGLTVVQLLAPLIFAVAAQTGIPQLGAYTATYIATQGTSCSPFSTGGAMALMNVTANMDRAKVMKQQIFITIVLLFVNTLTGFFLFDWMTP